MKIVRSLKNLSPDDPFLTQVHHEVQSIFYHFSRAWKFGRTFHRILEKRQINVLKQTERQKDCNRIGTTTTTTTTTTKKVTRLDTGVFGLHSKTCCSSPAVPEKVDNASIHWINRYPEDSALAFPKYYPIDSDLSGGWRCPTFEQSTPNFSEVPNVNAADFIVGTPQL